MAKLPSFDLFWYDGGIKPATPPEYCAEGLSLESEGLMFVGDKGKIICGFMGENPILFINNKMTIIEEVIQEPSGQNKNDVWINAFKNNTQSPGSFLNAGPVTETILLGSVSLRAGKQVEYDPVNMKITNSPEANKYLVREYREGWEL
jgi:hypothetical protein